MTPDLFEDAPREGPKDVPLGEGAMPLGGFARPFEGAPPRALDAVVAAAPFRHMLTPGGHRTSVALADRGAVGRVTDRTGYRHDAVDPDSGSRRPWMPGASAEPTAAAAAQSGYPAPAPDACSVDGYGPGARLSPHRDREERDLGAPIVPVSFGPTAAFLFEDLRRSAPTRRVVPRRGDAAAWAGPSRPAHHGVAPPAEGEHPAPGRRRGRPPGRSRRGWD